MKIEICSNTRSILDEAAIVIVWISGFISLVAVVWIICQYNKIPFERGYTQTQLENSQSVIWTRPSE